MSKRFGDTFDEEKTWHQPNGQQMTYEEVLKEIEEYLKIEGAKVYVGSDSMLSNFGCTFATTICMHFNKGQVANYYFQEIVLIQLSIQKFFDHEEHILNLRTHC